MAENRHCCSERRRNGEDRLAQSKLKPYRETANLHLIRLPASGTHNHLISTGLWVEPTHGFTACSTGILSSEPASLLACCFPWWVSHAPGVSNMKRSSLQFRLSFCLLHTMVSQGLLVGNPVNTACHQ